MPREPCDPRERWSDAGAGTAYATGRWARGRRRRRDPRSVLALLRGRGPLAAEGGDGRLILDAPCGTGRLREALASHGRYVGLDLSAAMLGTAAERADGAAWIRGDLERLPFRDASFEIVVCCRILHHLGDPDRFTLTVRELVRVSSGWIVATFWDAASLPAWRRRAFGSPRPSGRVAHRKPWVAEVFRDSGAPVTAWRHSLRFLSQQTYVLARREPPPRRG